MYSLSILIVTALAAMIIGAIIGALGAKTMSPEQQRSRDMESRLAKAESQLSDYQNQVSEHFADTSQLVNDLTQSYQNVHEYLANSALKLANPDLSRQLLEAGDGTLKPADTQQAEADTIAPARDWAPREPGQKGQLSEEFSLNEADKPQATQA